MHEVDARYRAHLIGELEAFTLWDGHVDRPVAPGLVANATVPEIGSALAAARLPASHLRLAFTALALHRRDRLILIDTGTGGAPVYGPHAGRLRDSMRAAGLDPRRVDTILLTHLHGDHLYGLMDSDTLAPVFPHADIVVPDEELAWWLRPEVDALDLGPTRAGLAGRIRRTVAVWPNVRTVRSGAAPVAGIRAVASPGHSPGHTAYQVATGARDLLVTADVALHPALFLRHPSWQPTLDQDPAAAVRTRRAMFGDAADRGLLVCGTHWGLDNIGTVTRDGDGFVFTPLAGRGD